MYISTHASILNTGHVYVKKLSNLCTDSNSSFDVRNDFVFYFYKNSSPWRPKANYCPTIFKHQRRYKSRQCWFFAKVNLTLGKITAFNNKGLPFWQFSVQCDIFEKIFDDTDSEQNTSFYYTYPFAFDIWFRCQKT